MKVETIRCDNCDKARDKDTNHWSTIGGIITTTTPLCWTGPLGLHPTAIRYAHLLKDREDFIYTADACGDECRFALMARFLAKGSFQRQSVADTIKAGR